MKTKAKATIDDNKETERQEKEGDGGTEGRAKFTMFFWRESLAMAINQSLTLINPLFFLVPPAFGCSM